MLSKIVSVGKSVKLECIVTWDSNVDTYWSKRNEMDDNLIYIATAGKSSEHGLIYPEFRNRHITVNYDKMLGTTSSKFIMQIWNITSMDSSKYTCYTFNYHSNASLDLTRYSVQVVDCLCAVDSVITCNLTGSYSQTWIPVTVHYRNHSSDFGIRNN